MGKSIIEIKEVLGEPSEYYPPVPDMGIDTDHMGFKKNLFELRLEYKGDTPEQMYLCAASGTLPCSGFYIGGSLDKQASNYKIREINTDNPDICTRSPECTTRDIWSEICQKFSQSLSEINLKDMVKKKVNKK